MKRIMVDMSVTILHHGHIRLLKKASEMGSVVVALTTDQGVRDAKGYVPELSYDERKEVLDSICYVDEVVPCEWLIDEEYLNKHNIDLLVHGDDNVNEISEDRLVIFPRTEGVSSSDIRKRVLNSLISINLNKQSPSDRMAESVLTIIRDTFKMD